MWEGFILNCLRYHPYTLFSSILLSLLLVTFLKISYLYQYPGYEWHRSITAYIAFNWTPGSEIVMWLFCTCLLRKWCQKPKSNALWNFKFVKMLINCLSTPSPNAESTNSKIIWMHTTWHVPRAHTPIIKFASLLASMKRSFKDLYVYLGLLLYTWQRQTLSHADKVAETENKLAITCCWYWSFSSIPGSPTFGYSFHQG